MKKSNVIISVILILLSVLLSSCAYAPEQTDTTRTPEASVNGDQSASAPDMKDKQITEVSILDGTGKTIILPLFDYGDGYLRSDKAGGTPQKTYPVTVEFDGDYVTVHYYVESKHGGALIQRSLVTGKNNVIIYYSEG